MIQLRRAQISEIHYTLITDHVPLVVPFLPPTQIPPIPFNFVKYLPKDLLQIFGGLNYFELCKKTGTNNPIRFQIVYNKNLNSYLKIVGSNVLNLFFVDHNVKSIQKTIEILEKSHSDLNYYHFFNNNSGVEPSLENIVKSPGDFMESIMLNYSKIFKSLKFPINSISPDVPVYDKSFYEFPPFIPAQNNYHIVNSVIGNFPYGLGKDSFLEEVMKRHEEATEKAFQAPNSFERMDMISKEIKKLDYFSLLLSKEKLINPVHPIDPVFSPLILVIPFHNPDIRHIKSLHPKGKEEFFNTFLKSLDIEQTQNYIGTSSPFDEDSIKLTGQLAISKNDYLDNVSLLHASFNFSPILRLPSLGKSIYRNLSFFRTEAMEVISQPKNRKKIKKTIKRFGDDLAFRTISEKVKKGFVNQNRQIVSITDLPVEWMNIDGIPLSFTHDVCRIPETSMHGILASFANNEQFEYSIPDDILNKTLVIYGSDEASFKQWRLPVDNLASTHGFKTRICLSVNSMIEAVKALKPEFLIFDCHGGYDENTKSSFLMLGDERLTGDIIVNYNIHAPLVFLSACNTAPTYGTINTIANAFFETNCLSVTTTYLPINIATGTILYLRLLNNLKMASTEAIHSNWLNFVSHMIRTSAVTDAFSFLNKIKNRKIDKKKVIALQTQSFNKLLSFHLRREVYKGLDENLRKLSSSDEQLFSKIIPEYLFYSNLGRSDLIKFEVHKAKYAQLNNANDQ